MTIGAITTRDDVAGGQRKTDGYWKHYGALDIGSARVTSRAGHPALTGAGVETIYLGPTSGGQIQCYNRDTQLFEPLSLSGSSIYLNVQPGGQLYLPANCIGTSQIQANAVQQQMGAFMSGSGWNSSSNGVWQESNIIVNNFTSNGLLTRVEWSVTFRNTVTGAVNNIAVGVDGTASLFQVAAVTTPSADYWSQVGGTIYITPAAGNHKLSIFVNTTSGLLYFHGGTYQCLVATEQKR